MEFHIGNEFFYVNGRPEPLLCGEIQYFRTPRSSWEPALQLLKEAGGNAVAFYIPWLVHEYREDMFDFSGATHEQNDLRAFLALTQKTGLIALARIGPYVYAETTDLGIPQWFFDKYPNAHPLEYADGQYKPYGMARYASHCHPDFLVRTRLWYDRVMAELRPYLAPQGHITMVQLCNEIPGEDHRDENPQTLGLGDANGLWPQWLQLTYTDAKHLGHCYGIEVTDLTNCPPHVLKQANPDRYHRDMRRYYYEHYYPHYFQQLKQAVGPLPDEVTLFHNAYNPKAYSLHAENKRKNPWLNIGVDCYYSMTGALTLEAATYFNDFGARYGRALIDNPPWVIEQACGYWNDTPIVYGPELYIWNVWSFAAGYCGANLYLLCAGENREGHGWYGTWHGWQAPITEEGQPGRTFSHIKRAFLDIRAHFADFCASDVYDIVFAVSGEAGLIWTPEANVVKNAFYALRAAGFNPRVVDVDGCAPEALDGCQAVWSVTGTTMSDKTQRKLLAFAQRGGRLIVQGALPLSDEEGQPCTILADALRLSPAPFTWHREDQEKVKLDAREFHIGQAVQPISGPDDAVLAYTVRDCRPAIWRHDNVLVLPFELQMLFFDMEKLLSRVLAPMGISPGVSGARYLRVFPKTGGRHIVLNLHPEEMRETITICGNTHDVFMPPYSFCVIENENSECS